MAKTKKTTIQPAVVNVKTKRNIVRVTVPAKDYFNLGSMQEIQRDILKELGCLACCSGWDIRFDMQRDFVIRR